MRAVGHRLVVLAVALSLGCGGRPASPPVAPEETAAVSTAAPTGESAAQCPPTPGRLCPLDEGTSDPSFNAFRQEMLGAIFTRDVEALVLLIDPAVRISFGEGGGIEEFRRHWRLDSERSALWDELTEVLRLGGSFLGEGEGRSFWAPYVYSKWPDELDPFNHVAATGPRVPIRLQAAETSEVVATAEWSILEVLEQQASVSGWLEVRDASGQKGWVRESDVRSPIDYRAGFVRHGSTWRLNALVAGD